MYRPRHEVFCRVLYVRSIRSSATRFGERRCRRPRDLHLSVNDLTDAVDRAFPQDWWSVVESSVPTSPRTTVRVKLTRYPTAWGSHKGVITEWVHPPP